jgi:hypothetical protein
MRHYEINDKEFRGQKDRIIIQTGIITPPLKQFSRLLVGNLKYWMLEIETSAKL